MQLNLSTTATLGTEKSGPCKEEGVLNFCELSKFICLTHIKF